MSTCVKFEKPQAIWNTGIRKGWITGRYNQQEGPIDGQVNHLVVQAEDEKVEDLTGQILNEQVKAHRDHHKKRLFEAFEDN